MRSSHPTSPPGPGNSPAARALGFLGAVLLALAPGAASSSDAAPSLTFEGYGAVRFGMTLAEAEHAMGSAAHTAPPHPDPQVSCYYAWFKAYPHARFRPHQLQLSRRNRT